MSDLFSTHRIYPYYYSDKIKEHFKDHYDAVFVAFIPFFQVDLHPKAKNFSSSGIISFEEAKEVIPGFKNMSEPNATIYSSNMDYPEDDIIYKNAKVVPWSDVVKGSGMKDLSELNKALRTSIGAVRKIFQRRDLTEKLENFTNQHHIWHPAEGHFDLISKTAIYKVFKLFQKTHVTLVDEFYERSLTLDIQELDEREFCAEIDFKDYYIYSSDKEILFTIDWDSFFYLIATSSENMEKILSANLFEGFLCNDKTTHDWDYEEGEINAYLKIEKGHEDRGNDAQ